MRRQVGWVWAALIAAAAYGLGLGVTLWLRPAAGGTTAASGAAALPQAVSFRPPGNSLVSLPPDGSLELTVIYDRDITSCSGLGLGGRLTPGEFTVLDDKTRRSRNRLTFTVQTYPGKELWLCANLKTQSGRTVDSWWPGYVRTAPRTNTDPDLARELHRRAWEETVARAETDDMARFAFYATRSLAVRHPEIYLRADRIFYETASRTKGFTELYDYDPPSWTWDKFRLDEEERNYVELFDRAAAEGSPLDLASLDLGRYQVTPRRELFPEGAPHYRLVDERLGVLPATLKRQGGVVTTLEMAALRYFSLLASGSIRPESSFLVYCEDESAYLWTQGEGWLDPATGGEAASPEATVVLAFNEDYAWYPLMGRDDTPRSGALRALVESLESLPAQGGSSGAGWLSEEERGLVTALREVTALGPGESAYALWAASKARYRAFAYESYREALADLPCLDYPDFASPGTPAFTKLHIAGHALQVLSSRLSPLAAWIAAQEFDDPLLKARAVTGLYYDLARAGPRTTARTVWRPEFLWFDIEDGVLCRGGTCAIQAGIVGALLDLAGIENYVVWVGLAGGEGHEYVWLPEFSREINNGYVVEVEGFLEEWLATGSRNLISLGSRGEFAAFVDEGILSTMSAVRLSEILARWPDKLSRVRFFGHSRTWSYAEVLAKARAGEVRPTGLKGGL